MEDKKINNYFIASLKSMIEQYEFLYDEVWRCYHDIDEYEAKISGLEKQKMNLVEALAKKTWADMRQSAFQRRQARKWRAKT